MKDPIEELIIKTGVARKAIASELKRRGLEKDPKGLPLDEKNAHRWCKPQENYYSGAGVMLCPICGFGKLYYSRAEYNGHVRAECSTNKCVSWIE